VTKINNVTDLSYDGKVAVVTLNSPPVNALAAPVIEGLFDAFNEAIASNAKAIVLICEGRTFIAGADIGGFGNAKNPRATLLDVQKVMENSPKPVVAAIHGTALGGGLETALAANYRVMAPSAKVGLPEVRLGLLPGAGGTQRLPRLTGPEKALELVTSGRHVGAKEALECGIVDEIVEEGKLREGAMAYACKLVAENRPLKKVRDRDDKVAPYKGNTELFANFRHGNARRFRGFKAPEYNIRALEAAVNLPFDEGIAEERRLFQELLASPESAAQRYSFFIERSAQKIPGIGPEVGTQPIGKVGVVGAGTMGGGIAMNFANAGIPVTIVEMTEANLTRGLGVIKKNYDNTAARGGLTTGQVEERYSKLTSSLNMEDLADCDLIIEAVFEDMEVKKQIFGRLDQIVRPGAILATNTSFLDVNEIAGSTGRPESVIGLHFFSPANVMKLLEIVRARETSKEVLATAVKLAKTIGKIGVVVGVCDGFVGNRMLDLRQLQAAAVAIDGANFWDVDRLLYEFGFPMGPYAMMDLVGLDVLKDRPGQQTLRSVLAARGRLGQKGIGGFYDYDEKRNPTPSPATLQTIEEARVRLGIKPRPVSDEEILERTLYIVINEGAKVLQEGIAIRSSDIDVIWQSGYGWPAYRGGPMYYADEVVGLPKILERLKVYQAEVGDQFKPAALLEQLVAEGKKFSDLEARA
jgi:3-hydroxyacyl-CoA dehydrogenase